MSRNHRDSSIMTEIVKAGQTCERVEYLDSGILLQQFYQYAGILVAC